MDALLCDAFHRIQKGGAVFSPLLCNVYNILQNSNVRLKLKHWKALYTAQIFSHFFLLACD